MVEGVFALITGGLSLAIKVAVIVIVVQQIEGNVVAPKVQSDAVNIHPLGVMFALLACSELWGPVGMLISTPVAVVFKTVIREIYNYILGDQRPSQPQPAEGPAPRAGKKRRGRVQEPAAPEKAPEKAPEAPAAPEKAPAKPEDDLSETISQLTRPEPPAKK